MTRAREVFARWPASRHTLRGMRAVAETFEGSLAGYLDDPRGLLAR